MSDSAIGNAADEHVKSEEDVILEKLAETEKPKDQEEIIMREDSLLDKADTTDEEQPEAEETVSEQQVQNETQETAPEEVADETATQIVPDPIMPELAAEEFIPEAQELSNQTPLSPEKKQRKLVPEIILPSFLRNYLGKYARAYAVLLMVLIIGGAGLFGYLSLGKKQKTVLVEAPGQVRFDEVADPFGVVSTKPLTNERGVGRSMPIAVTFNRDVDPDVAKDNFFFTPKIEGTFSSGATKKEVLFTPKVPFESGADVELVVQSEMKAGTNEILGEQFNLRYTTSIGAGKVEFLSEAGFSDLTNVKPDSEQKFTLYTGEGVDPKASIKVYKATVDKLLESFVYGEKQDTQVDGKTYPYTGFLRETVNTTGLTALTTQTGVGDQTSYTFKQPAGVYVVVAETDKEQFGWTWVVVGDSSLIVRQDDKKVVVANTASADKVTNLKFFSLNDKVKLLKSDDFAKSVQAYDFAYSEKVDFVTAQINGNEIVVPLEVFGSGADLHLRSDYSSSIKTTILTEKATYVAGETVKYGGFARIDNDAQYLLPAKKTLTFYAQSDKTGEKLADLSAVVDAHGVLNGQIATKATWVPNDATSATVNLYMTQADQTVTYIGSFTVQKSQNAKVIASVTYDKQSYLADESVVAHAHVRNADTNAKPDNLTAKYTVYAKSYYEDNQALNASDGESLGEIVGDEKQSLTLNASGDADITVPLNKIKAASSQLVTVQVSATDAQQVEATASANTVVHEGDGIVSFGITKTRYVIGDDIVARVLTRTLANTPLPNTTVTYSFVKTEYDSTSQKSVNTVLASGTSKTDAKGFVEIVKNKLTGTAGSISLEISFADAHNNRIKNSLGLYVFDPKEHPYHVSEAEIRYLDVKGVDSDVKVGDTIEAIVVAPEDMTVLASVERGRMYSYEVVSFKKGNNTYKVPVDAKLAPSFTVSFAFFLDNDVVHEGFNITVDSPAAHALTKIETDKTTYTSNEKPSVTITTLDASKQPIAASVLVTVTQDNSFTNNSVFAEAQLSEAWYGWRDTTINTSSSFTGLATGGGRCGGHDFGYFNAVRNRLSSVLYFSTTLRTDVAGKLTIPLPYQKGVWRLTVQTASDDSLVSGASATFTAQ